MESQAIVLTAYLAPILTPAPLDVWPARQSVAVLTVPLTVWNVLSVPLTSTLILPYKAACPAVISLAVMNAARQLRSVLCV